MSRESAASIRWVVAAREDREYVGDVAMPSTASSSSRRGWARHGHYRESAFYRARRDG